MDHARKIAAWRRASKRGPYPFELSESELLEAMKAMDEGKGTPLPFRGITALKSSHDDGAELMSKKEPWADSI